MGMKLVLATANPNKAREIREILEDRVSLIPRPQDVPSPMENGGTLLVNARLKAAAVSCATALPALADDTGFEIEALHGRPGVDAAYFAGPRATSAENCEKAIASLRGFPRPEQRRAWLRTVALMRWPSGEERWHEGACEGIVATAPAGDARFGYDSVFIPVEGDGRTFAELQRYEKHRLSHRRRAFVGLVTQLGI